MFEAKLAEGIIFKKIVEAIKELVSDVNIDISPTGISLQAMDNSHVALVSLQLSMDGFESFRSDKPMTLGINIGNLFKIMKLGDNDDSMTLKAEEDPSHLTIIFENEKKGRFAEFNINLINIDTEHLSVSDNEGGSQLSMASGEFSKIMKELYQISETVNIETSQELIQFSVEGDCGSGSVKIGPTEGETREEQVVIQSDEQVNLSFALRYLTMFTKASGLSSMVNVSLSTEAPLVVKYEIQNLGSLQYYLAPKISDEE
ncbi:unnamed protein product [Moneuplotes crassus]|uniref:DNA sliding clamp PCNA n=1 Tax=Euplotes crassus TaxID=5936 RepID=A0AAD2D1D6_EUPCR|nr:unnamed protein product [Moneuplotes crassus]